MDTSQLSDEQLLSQCRLETFRAGGPGGQHQNTSDTGVRLVHLPTGIRVTAREHRSQLRNRTAALQRLRKKLAERARKPAPRIPTRVPEAQRRKRLEEKRRRSRTKGLRKPPPPED
ncbi:MAG: peptide chain release factor family protein [Gemmatimonadota bacterium]